MVAHSDHFPFAQIIKVFMADLRFWFNSLVLQLEFDSDIFLFDRKESMFILAGLIVQVGVARQSVVPP